MSAQVGGHGFGNVGLGIGGVRSTHQTIPSKCADEGHPGVTYHPQMNQTWCLCGEVTTVGNAVIWPKPTDCGGPLVACHHPT